MIVLRFKAQIQPDKVEATLAAFREVVAPSRETEGVISFDIGRDLADPNSIVAVEVFQDAAARQRQEALPEVGNVMSLLPEALSAPPEATVYQISSSESAL
jgi:quinol monooxygenase YgiN